MSEIKVDLIKNLSYGGEHIVAAGTFDGNSDYVRIGTGYAVINRFDTEHLIDAEVKKLRDKQRAITERKDAEFVDIENKISQLRSALKTPKGE